MIHLKGLFTEPVQVGGTLTLAFVTSPARLATVPATSGMTLGLRKCGTWVGLTVPRQSFPGFCNRTMRRNPDGLKTLRPILPEESLLSEGEI